MAFQVAEADTSGNIMSGTIKTLFPGPTYVIYPDKILNTIRESRDGAVTVQAPLKDPRPRSWVWVNYKATVINYTDLYKQILNYQYKNRINNLPAKSQWVYVKEDQTGNLTKLQWSGSGFSEINDWVRVRVTQVTQNVAQQAGQATYAQTIMQFYVDDPTWNWF